MSEKDILGKLLIDEKEILEGLVQKSEKILRIDKKTGDTVIVAPKSKLSDRELIAIILLSKYFSSKLNLVTSDTMTPSEISQKLGIEEASVSARLSDLKRERVVEMVSRGEYRISYANIERVLDDIQEKVAKLA